MIKSKATLPKEVAETLVQLKSSDPTSFSSHILALRNVGWPCRAIADAFGVSRTAASHWEKSARENDNAVLRAHSIQVPSLPIDGFGSKITKERVVPDITAEQADELANLTEVASKNTRWHSEESPERKAAAELVRLLTFYTETRKVPLSVLARHAKVTRRALAQRMESSTK